MKKFNQLIVAVAAMSLVACGGSSGGGNSSTGGTYLTHSEIASDFVYRMNVDAGANLELVKTHTEQYDYIVVYDYDFGTYDAYYLGGYNPGEDVVNYLYSYDSNFYYDLDDIGYGDYQDWDSGIIFEKTETSDKDLQQMAALEQGLKIKKSADHIMAEFNLSESRSLEVARLAVQMSNAPKDSMTDNDYNNFAKEILGNTITEYKQAVTDALQGDKSGLNSLIDQAADVNGVTPEDVEKIIGDVFGEAVL